MLTPVYINVESKVSRDRSYVYVLSYGTHEFYTEFRSLIPIYLALDKGLRNFSHTANFIQLTNARLSIASFSRLPRRSRARSNRAQSEINNFICSGKLLRMPRLLNALE